MECPPSRIRTMSGQESRASGAARPPSEEGQLDSRIVAEVLAALAYGEQRGARRSQQSVGLAPDGGRAAPLALLCWLLIVRILEGGQTPIVAGQGVSEVAATIQP